MDIPVTEIGVGGVFAIIVIREVLGFMKTRNGNSYPTRREFEDHKKSVQYKDTCGEIVKRFEENHREVIYKLDKLLEK